MYVGSRHRSWSSFPRSCLLGQGISLGPGADQLSWDSWPVTPRGSFVSASPMLRLQVHTSLWFFMWQLGIELGSSHLRSEHLATKSSPSPSFLFSDG